jgi:hypothetical protein
LGQTFGRIDRGGGVGFRNPWQREGRSEGGPVAARR